MPNVKRGSDNNQNFIYFFLLCSRIKFVDFVLKFENIKINIESFTQEITILNAGNPGHILSRNEQNPGRHTYSLENDS